MTHSVWLTIHSFWRNSYIHSGIVGSVEHDRHAEPDNGEGRIALGEGEDDEEDGGPDESNDRERFPGSTSWRDLESIFTDLMAPVPKSWTVLQT